MRDCSVDDGNLHQILLCILNSLGDSGGNLISLTKTITYNAVLVSYHYDSCEAEVTASFGNLGYSLDGNQSVFQFKIRGLYSFNICICHSLYY